MSRSRSRDLTEDERILWNLVARTAHPLKGKALQPAENLAEEPAAPKAVTPATPSSASPPVKTPAQDRRQIHHLDRVTQKKISKGRLPLEARIDLHGLRQDEAYGLLLSFLNRAHASGIRYVLVITGKGRSSASDGVLRRSVPSWFTTVPFRPLVSGYEDAARNHGGEGALYVRLRRLPHETAT
jgi:DNA-nicking Smr family endonuclease